MNATSNGPSRDAGARMTRLQRFIVHAKAFLCFDGFAWLSSLQFQRIYEWENDGGALGLSRKKRQEKHTGREQVIYLEDADRGRLLPAFSDIHSSDNGCAACAFSRHS